MGKLFSFPNPVNEWAARLVAFGVFCLCVLITLTGWGWPIIILALGFLARLAGGPRYSPLGRLAVFVAGALFLPKMVPGPPKRFAQGIGSVLSVVAIILFFGFGLHHVAIGVILLIQAAALLEYAFGFCVGCAAFRFLMRSGVIPADVCLACNDLTAR